MHYYFISTCFLLILISYNKVHGINSSKNDKTIIDRFKTHYVQLPEQEIAKSLDHKAYAQYAMPTKQYSHSIWGDTIEAQQLVVVVDDIFYETTLQNRYVFEDIRPRLYDVDGDQILEFVTIRTHENKGAGIVIYKIKNKRLTEYAYVLEIGIAYRWLNIVAIHDLDHDGNVELVWIQTPHIGGILKVAEIKL